jgi:hypothetical protein
MEDKIAAFNTAIETAAAGLGLVFAYGADPIAQPTSLAVSPSIGATNGQRRAVYLFAVAESVT